MILNPRQGFDPEDIDIRVEGGKLIMVGEREIKRGNSFSKRMFNQKFDLPEGIDIDGITGGYNFQAAWTGGRLAGLAMANEQK